MQLERYHGLGNDYLVLVDGPPMTASLARAVCHRHTGVGGDGVLEPTDSGPADYGVRIWNPDGSVAEKSGNGLRIYARWLRDACNAPRSFTVWTGASVVGCVVDPKTIVLDMGTASFEPGDVPHRRAQAWIEEAVETPSAEWDATAVGLGNPHCVVFVDEPFDALDWRRGGSELEVHPEFPNRTNVQFVRVVGDQHLDIRIWERGAGETTASGSSSCAAAAAAVRTGRLRHGPVRVDMPGGTLDVVVSEDWAIQLAGPVVCVGSIAVDAAWLDHAITSPTTSASSS